MPGVNIGAKRGSQMRQHQVSKTRMLRNRSQIPVSPPDDAATQKSVKKETLITNVPLHCNPLLPDLHCFGNMGFEVLLFLYLLTALFCQYIYLYKTVWWYPVSLPPSTTSLNFHLIDRNLTVFLTVFISRRLLWSVLWDFLRPRCDNAPGIMAWILICLLSGIFWVLCLITPLVHLFYSTSLLNMVVLCYPILLWIPLTGLSGDSCLNLVLSWSNIADQGKLPNSDAPENGNSTKKYLDTSVTRLMTNSDQSSLQLSYASFGNSCNPQVVRREAKLLCQDFNSRISEIVFCSMVCSYYVGLVPMFFMKSHQYYDMVWSLQHTVLVLLNSFGLLSSHLLNPQYLHVLHRGALLLEEIHQKPLDLSHERSTKTTQHFSEQTTSTNDFSSTSASHSTATEVPTQDDNSGASITEDPTNVRFYNMFSDPLRLTNWLLMAHVAIVIFQVYLLVSSSKWDHLISIALMQFFSYYVLFRTARDRIVLGKAHLLHTLMFGKDPPIQRRI